MYLVHMKKSGQIVAFKIKVNCLKLEGIAMILLSEVGKEKERQKKELLIFAIHDRMHRM